MNPPIEKKSTTSFFRLERGDGVFLTSLIVFSIIIFLPPWRRIHIAGMALFGWLMAFLMFAAPLIAFIRYLRR